MQPMLIEGEHGFGARLTKLFADLRVFEPESLRTLPSLRSWLVAHSLLVPIPDAVQIQPPTTHGELRQAEAPLEALARDVYARVASRREDHTGFVASEMASLSEAELAQTLQVRLCSRIEAMPATFSSIRRGHAGLRAIECVAYTPTGLVLASVALTSPHGGIANDHRDLI